MSDRRDPARLDREAYPGPGIELPVLYADLDPNSHLNNVAMGRFFEHARATAIVETGFMRAVHAGGAQSFVVRVAIDYLAEAYATDLLHVRSRLARIGTSSMTLEQAAWRDGTCIALAEVVFAHVRDGVSEPWGDASRAALESLRA